MQDFHKMKEHYMKKLEYFKNLGEVDKEIYFLIDYINSLDNYFTTSSCAGRIILLKVHPSGKKKYSEFLFKSHQPVNFENIWKFLNKIYPSIKEYIMFKQDPWILHIAAKDIDSAKILLKIMQRAGIKRSGIFHITPERVMLEIQSDERIECPVAYNFNLLINKEYFKFLVDLANKKLKKTRYKMEKFYEELKNYFE